MFGYVRPLKSELKLREYNLYQAWYCGLCKTLRHEYGQIPRMVLDYDCTFLAILLFSLQEESFQCHLEKCYYKPFKKAAPVVPACPALYYAADINLLLYYYKMMDDWQDEKKIAALLGCGVLYPAKIRSEKKQPQTQADIIDGLNALSQLEQNKERSIDMAADCFAVLLQKVTLGYDNTDVKQLRALSWLAYHLGRFIYLADAWEDRKKDKANGAYNPFLINQTTQEHASFLLYASLNEMEKAYDLLTIYNNRSLLDNILYEGCRHVCKQVLEGAKG